MSIKLVFFWVRETEVEFFNKLNKYGYDLKLVEKGLNHENVKEAIGAEAIMVRGNCMADRQNLELLSKHGLKYVLTRTVGFDHVDLEAVKDLGLKSARVPGYSPNAISELAVTLAMMLLRHTAYTVNRTKDKDFTIDATMFSREIRNCTVGIIGTGRIGLTTARLFKGLGAKVLGYDVFQSDAAKEVVEFVSEDELLKLAAAAEKGSEHPLGEAIVKEAENRNINLPQIKTFNSIPGEGIITNIEGKDIVIGNRKIMDRNKIDITSIEAKAHELADSGKTPMFIAIDGTLAGIIAVADTVKENSKKAVKALHDMGIEVVMLTGDNEKTAKSIAKQVGIDRVISDVLPEGKANVIKDLQKEGKKVAMVGDGINDAPALVTAEIGMAIGSGTDVAIESADIVLMRSDILDVVGAIQLSRATIRNIKQNLFWAFGYNVLGIPVAMGILKLFGGPLLNPMIGSFAMSLSSVSVLLNALRLKGFKPKF